ncbi:hypothetical protein [Janthinobacterium sp. HLX7-2]|uniref:hypothetical protein n=1 Tax=Janthinobacterium sp. HLX7-2 TaxID=1259331 RepID=UPI003F27AC71
MFTNDNVNQKRAPCPATRLALDFLHLPSTPEQYQFTNSLALHSPLAQQLSNNLPDGAIDWIDANVGSPVAGHWGVAAAVLGMPWPR